MATWLRTKIAEMTEATTGLAIAGVLPDAARARAWATTSGRLRLRDARPKQAPDKPGPER